MLNGFFLTTNIYILVIIIIHVSFLLLQLCTRIRTNFNNEIVILGVYFTALSRSTENQPAKKSRNGDGDGSGSGGRDHLAYICLLQNELLGAQNEEVRGPSVTCVDGNKSTMSASPLVSTTRNNLPVFRFKRRKPEVSAF